MMTKTNAKPVSGEKGDFVRSAYALFDEFYDKSQKFREKCREAEQFYRARHWADNAKPDEPKPVTPALFSTLESLLADIMDSYPEAILLPVESGDEKTANTLSQIVKSILKRRKYRCIYRRKCRHALKKGVSVQEVFWDTTLYNGLGDINIRDWPVENFLFDPYCEDIQQGRACFKFAFMHRDAFKAMYPWAAELAGRERYTRDGLEDDTYRPYDENADVMLVEYWYKKHEDGVERVHMAKLAGGLLLERSEDDHPEGLYAHGKYPFIVEALYPLEGTPMGLGIIDIFKNLQQYADKLDQILLKNALMSGNVKMLVNRNAELDEDALLDWRQEVIRGSRIDDGAVRWFQPAPISPYALHHFNNKIGAIKEESGQNQFNRGEAGNGVTAASAILALQEAGGKRSRMIIEQLYDGFEQLVEFVIALIGEYYTEARRFRITDENSAHMEEFTRDALMSKTEQWERFVEFDVHVAVQKQTPFRTAYQNELALQMLRLGVLSPGEALSLMNFEGREKVLSLVQKREDEQRRIQSVQSVN